MKKNFLNFLRNALVYEQICCDPLLHRFFIKD